MRKDRIILNFVRPSIAQKIETGRNVIAKMKANPKFATPDVKIEDLEAKTDLLEARSLAAQGGGKEATALMHQTEKEWIDLMRKMAKYVDRIADGDGATILNAGFSLAKQPAPAFRPDFSVELGEKSGTVVLHRQAIEGAKAYIWQYCMGEMPADNDSGWVTALVTSKVTAKISGLIPLNKYWFRSAVVTAAGTSAYNSPEMQVVI